MGKVPGMMALWRSMYRFKHKKLEKKVLGLNFPNPVGLAAGFDKNAKWVDELACFGFGFLEIGTVTPKSQKGNEKPRLFRLPEDQAIINRMGFNNDGVDAVVKRLRKRNSNIIIGGNIGKNKFTPNEEAYRDYEIAFETLFPMVDYFVVNVSSPNTPDLRALQDKEPLTFILNCLKNLNEDKPKPKPVLLKIAPDLSESQLNDIVEIVKEVQVDGLVATNTTINRDGLKSNSKKIGKIGNGGLSGAPLRQRSTEVLAYLRKALPKPFPIIAVGGIMSEKDAVEKFEAGATLIQLYTGFIYEGPVIVKKINKRLAKAFS